MLPEPIFLALKAAFDLAKKTADDPLNPFKGIVNLIEPVHFVQSRLRFTLTNSDRSL